MEFQTFPFPKVLDRSLVETIPTLDLAKLANLVPTPKQFIVPQFIPAGEVTLFTGPGSAGKSLLAQQLATSLAAGLPTLRLETGSAHTVYLTCEDDEDQLHWRQSHICTALGVAIESLAGKLNLASMRGKLNNLLGIELVKGEFQPSQTYDNLADLIRRTKAKFVALDNVAHLFGGNENDRGEVTRFVNVLNRLASDTGAAIVLIGHPNKAGDNYSGSTAWLNAVRSQIFIDHDLNTDVRTLTAAKANYAKKGEYIKFVWLDWAFVHELDVPRDIAIHKNNEAKEEAENTLFMRCLEICTAQNRNVSHQPGSNYAPKTFSKMVEGKALRVERYAAALERLLSLGKIEIDVPLWPDMYRRKKRGIRAVVAPI